MYEDFCYISSTNAYVIVVGKIAVVMIMITILIVWAMMSKTLLMAMVIRYS